MDEKRLREMADELAKGVKIQKDLGKLPEFMIKRVIEMVLKAAMAEHLDHEKIIKSVLVRFTIITDKKTVISDDSALEIVISRDRESGFEP